MNQDILNTFNDLAKNTVDAMRSLGDINSKSVEKVLKHQLSAANLYMESTLEQVKLTQEIKNPADYKEYLRKQSELAREYAEKFQDVAKANMALAQDIGTEYKTWVEKGVKDLGVQPAAKSTGKKA